MCTDWSRFAIVEHTRRPPDEHVGGRIVGSAPEICDFDALALEPDLITTQQDRLIICAPEKSESEQPNSCVSHALFYTTFLSGRRRTNPYGSKFIDRGHRVAYDRAGMKHEQASDPDNHTEDALR